MNIALRTAAQAKATRVHLIRLRVGRLSGVVPDALQFAFEALARDTLAQGATLAVEDVAPRFWCAACAREFESDDWLAECPQCHTVSRELRAGRELEVTSLEID